MGDDAKRRVQSFWDKAACGEALYLADRDREGFLAQSEQRYRLEPFIEPFADFSHWRGKRVLEIGLGLGADHQRFAEQGAITHGVDLTARSVHIVRQRMLAFGLPCRVVQADAEALPFPDRSFDLVWSWGVIHHSPDTARAAAEILRVLKPGGSFRVMIYHRFSLVGIMLWVRYALMRGRPWLTLDDVYAAYLESPGTKAYSPKEAKRLFAGAARVQCRIELTHGDLLSSEAGQRHRGPMLALARRIWPRRLLERYAKDLGLFLLIEGEK